MTVRVIIFILLELLLLYILFGGYLRRKFSPAPRRLRLLCRDYAVHLRRIIRHDRDLLTQKKVTELRNLQRRAREISQDREMSLRQVREKMQPIEEEGANLLVHRQHKNAWISETMEVVVVALVLAFGFRALFLQPFKIPTGSMEPTLYGIHFVEDKDLEPPSLPRRVFDYLHFSNRYVDETVQRSGRYEGARPGSSLPMMQSTIVTIAGIDYELPGNMEAVKKQVPEIGEFENHYQAYHRHREHNNNIQQPRPPHFEAGDILARGYLRAGDHVFVNRLGHHFTDIDRGDVVVFLTDGLTDPQGNPLRGRFFIKRLVGMPGDTLKINEENQLLIKPEGAEAFSLLDGDHHPAFERIYSELGGYHGYVADMPGAEHSLTTPYKVPEDHYFMLGDNSAHSQDSRYWGAVPRENIIGQATLAWWPLSRRWGLIDLAEPEPVPTEERTPGQITRGR